MIVRTQPMLQIAFVVLAPALALGASQIDREVVPESTCLLQSHKARDANAIVDAGGDAVPPVLDFQESMDAVEVQAAGMLVPGKSAARSSTETIFLEVSSFQASSHATEEATSSVEVGSEEMHGPVMVDAAPKDVSLETNSLEGSAILSVAADKVDKRVTSDVESEAEGIQELAPPYGITKDASSVAIPQGHPPALSGLQLSSHVTERASSKAELGSDSMKDAVMANRRPQEPSSQAVSSEVLAVLSVLPLSSHAIDGLAPVATDTMQHAADKQANALQGSIVPHAQAKDASSWVNSDTEVGTEIVQRSDAPQGRGPTHEALLLAQDKFKKLVSHTKRSEALWVISLGLIFVVIFVALVIQSALAAMSTKRGTSRPGSPEKTPRTPRSLFFAGKSAQLPSAPTLSTSSWQGSPASTLGSPRPTPRTRESYVSSAAEQESVRGVRLQSQESVRGRFQSDEDDLWTATPPDTSRPPPVQLPGSRGILCPALAVPEGGNGSLLAVPFFRGVPAMTQRFDAFVLDASGKPHLSITLDCPVIAGRSVERLSLADCARGRPLASCLCNASPSRILSADGSTHSLVVEQTESAAATGGRSFSVTSPAGSQLLEVHGREGGQSFVFRSPGRSAAGLAEPGFERDGLEFYWLRVAAGVDLVTVVLVLLCVDRLHAYPRNSN